MTIPRSRSAFSVASTFDVGAEYACEDAQPARDWLVCIDNTQDSVAALAWTIQHLCRDRDCKVHLLHVIPEPSTVHVWPGIYVPPDDAEEQEEFKEAISMVREAFAPLLSNHGVLADAHIIVAADDPDTIAGLALDKADHINPVGIVVANHGKQGLKELWAGSVTRALVLQSRRPVLVYRSGHLGTVQEDYPGE